jgi:2-keto-4-pentenoate hydratase/2-oxohepta-3-ene-1,7-dioic acid hydratase in catechol pathway
MSKVPSLQVPTIPIAESNAHFPVRRIVCVRQNYADHAREMGSDPNRQAPFFFTKPADAVVGTGLRVPFVAFLSTDVAVGAGDLIFTGTPAGVGPIRRGERVRVRLPVSIPSK